MKNLKLYSKDCFQFFTDVVNSKRNKKDDPDFKIRLLSLSDDIKIMINDYSDKFKNNSLERITAFGYEGSDSDDLKRLYNYKSKLIQELKIYLTTDKNNRIDNTCQNCTIGEINSFDHYLPKTEFPEHAVNPNNLIPSCTKCNSYKSVSWLGNGKRIFLNLYIDKLPDVQYLFVSITINNDQIGLHYYLDDKNDVVSDALRLLSDHYEKLHLFERFKENSDNVISELDTEISKYSSIIPINEIKQVVIEEIHANYNFLGRNNWKLILKEALINNPEYLKRFQ